MDCFPALPMQVVHLIPRGSVRDECEGMSISFLSVRGSLRWASFLMEAKAIGRLEAGR